MRLYIVSIVITVVIVAIVNVSFIVIAVIFALMLLLYVPIALINIIAIAIATPKQLNINMFISLMIKIGLRFLKTFHGNVRCPRCPPTAPSYMLEIPLVPSSVAPTKQLPYKM